MLEAVQYACEDARIAIEMAVNGGEWLFADDMWEFAWHNNYHGGGEHYVVTTRTMYSSYWSLPENLGWILAHEFAHHPLYGLTAEEEEDRANAYATKCMNYNALVGY